MPHPSETRESKVDYERERKRETETGQTEVRQKREERREEAAESRACRVSRSVTCSEFATRVPQEMQRERETD